MRMSREEIVGLLSYVETADRLDSELSRKSRYLKMDIEEAVKRVQKILNGRLVASTFMLPEGMASLSFPEEMSDASFKEFVEWIELILKNAKRRIKEARTKETQGDPPGQAS